MYTVQVQQRGQQDALLREQQSMLILRELVLHSLQVGVPAGAVQITDN